MTNYKYLISYNGRPWGRATDLKQLATMIKRNKLDTSKVITFLNPNN